MLMPTVPERKSAAHVLDDGGSLGVSSGAFSGGQKYAQLDTSERWKTVSPTDPSHPSFQQQRPPRKTRVGGSKVRVYATDVCGHDERMEYEHDDEMHVVFVQDEGMSVRSFGF